MFRRATVTLTASLDVPQAAQGAPHAEDSSPSHAAHGSSASPSGSAAPAKPLKPLNDLEKRFAFEYAQDCNAVRAYMRTTGTTRYDSAATMGHRWINRVEIRAQIDVEMAELQKRAGVTTEAMLKRLWSMCTADPRELVEHYVEACRYCYGEGHLYQRTDTELRRDRLEFETHGRQRINGVYVGKRGKRKAEEPEEFQEQGGGGFDPSRRPHADCPECHGHGYGRTVFKDTRLISPQAALLLAGVKEGKEGKEIKFHDPMVAFEKIAKHVGFYDADNRQKKADDPFMAMLARISGPGAALPVNPNPVEDDDE